MRSFRGEGRDDRASHVTWVSASGSRYPMGLEIVLTCKRVSIQRISSLVVSSCPYHSWSLMSPSPVVPPPLIFLQVDR
eukprot:756895-Hanusia_phi.AAC.2